MVEVGTREGQPYGLALFSRYIRLFKAFASRVLEVSVLILAPPPFPHPGTAGNSSLPPPCATPQVKEPEKLAQGQQHHHSSIPHE